MARGEIGEPREAGMNVLLYFVTLTGFWFWWQYKAFKEIENQRESGDLKVKLWVFGLLVPTWVLGVALWTMHLLFDKKWFPKAPVFLTLKFAPFFIAGVVVLCLYFFLQQIFSRNMNELVRIANESFGDDRSPPEWLAMAYGRILMGFWLPYIWFVMIFFGVLMWIIWAFNIQEAINRYWLGHVSLDAETPAGLKAPI